VIWKRLTVLLGSALLVGCSASNVWTENVQVPNWFGTPFQDREAALLQIPPGTPVAKAEAIMRAHGMDLWCRQRQDYQMSLTFHKYRGEMQPAWEDIWVTLFCDEGVVVNAVVTVPAPPG
jgi:hypothetical protein